MKKLYIALLFIICAFNGFAQEIGYGYDAAGNRISRYLIPTPKSAGTDDEVASPQEFKLDKDTDIRLYPNPTSGILNFEVINPELEDNPNVQIKIYSVDGTLLREEEYLITAFTIDITGERNGTYLLDMQVNGKKQYFTIIKK